jgi:hypothetical protein
MSPNPHNSSPIDLVLKIKSVATYFLDRGFSIVVLSHPTFSVKMSQKHLKIKFLIFSLFFASAAISAEELPNIIFM